MLHTVQEAPAPPDATDDEADEVVGAPGADLGRRERKKRATRCALAAAALRPASERGPAGVTVEDISDAADVSSRTFFNYFGSKEAAILSLAPDAAAELRARVLARPPDEPSLEALRVGLTEASATQTQDAEAWWLKMKLVRDHPTLFPG
jgi:AcrR family transcriptional regulator